MPAPKPMKQLDAFGAMLRAARERKRWSQDVLAEAAGIPQSVASELENGKRTDIRSSQIAALAKALDLDPGDLARAAVERVDHLPSRDAYDSVVEDIAPHDMVSLTEDDIPTIVDPATPPGAA